MPKAFCLTQAAVIICRAERKGKKKQQITSSMCGSKNAMAPMNSTALNAKSYRVCPDRLSTTGQSVLSSLGRLRLNLIYNVFAYVPLMMGLDKITHLRNAVMTNGQSRRRRQEAAASGAVSVWCCRVRRHTVYAPILHRS
jgi:hypothetical protein